MNLLNKSVSSPFLLSALPLTAALGLFLAPTTASAVNVSLELALVVDESGSVDNGEWLLQRNGYVQAFQSAAVKNAIIGSTGGIAVTYIQFDDDVTTGIGWTHLQTAADADAFAALIAAELRFGNAGTAVARAINYTYPLFGTETGGAANGFESPLQIIDVSGDGANNLDLNGNAGPAANLTDTITNNAAAAGVDRINGVVIDPNGEAGLLAFYQNQVQQGASSFTLTADNFLDFQTAIERKIEVEIRGVPEGGSTLICGGISLLMLGLFGALRRKPAVA